MTHVPSFRRRRVTTPSASTPILAVVPIPPSVSLFIEDNEVFPHDANLRPRKRKVVDIEEGVSAVIDLLEGEFMVRETETIYVGEDIGATSEVPQLE